jgi:hypothetical protein
MRRVNAAKCISSLNLFFSKTGPFKLRHAPVLSKIARMLVPKFVCEMSRTSLLTIHFVKEAYNSTLSHTKKEFRNTLARLWY